MEFTKDKLQHIQSKLIVTKAKALQHGQFEAVISTEDLDRHNEKVSIKGMAIPNRTMKMYYNHETNGSNLPIGKWNKIWKSGGKLMGQGEVDLEDDFALKVYKKIQGGFIDSISVSFVPQEFDADSMTWTKSEMFEASVVAEPANVNAVITQKELGFTPKEFEKSLKVKLKEVETDEDDKDTIESPERDDSTNSQPVTDEKKVTVKRIVKGAVEDVLTSPKKWELMRPYYDILYAFEEAYYNEDTDVNEFSVLLNEAIGLLQQVADGTYDVEAKQASDESGASEISEIKSAIDELNSRQGALEEALKAATENPAKKNLIKVRVALKSVGQRADEANRLVKVKLKDI